MPRSKAVNAMEGKEFLIRVDLEGVDVPEFDKKMSEWMSSKGLKCVACHEYPHDNYHYHFWCKSERDMKVPGLRKSFLAALPALKGNKSYSFVCRPGDLIYIAKGPKTVSDRRKEDFPGERHPPEIIFNTLGFTPDEIMSAHDEWWTKYGTKTDKEEHTNGGKKETNTMLELLYHSIPDKEIAVNWDMIECGIYIQKYYLDNFHKYPIDHFAKSLVKGLWVRLADRKRVNARMAKIAHNWCQGIDDYLDSNFKCTDYSGFEELQEWDPIEKKII